MTSRDGGGATMDEFRIPDELRYSEADEWGRLEGDRVTVGISDFAQQQLGDIVFVELPEVGDVFSQGQVFGVVESVKAVSDLFAPIAGEILEVNSSLADAPDAVNEDCYGRGWLVVFRPADPGDFEGLMDSGSYASNVAKRAE